MPARRYLFRAVVVLVAATLADACGSSPVAPGDEEPLAFTRLRAEPYSYIFYSGLTQPARVVVKTQTQWQEIWSTIWKRNSEPPALPAIDFEREMVIVAAMGARPTGGYSVLIESASESVRGVMVRVRSISPGSGCGLTPAVTQPVDIARLPRRDRSIAFNEELETRPCNP